MRTPPTPRTSLILLAAALVLLPSCDDSEPVGGATSDTSGDAHDATHDPDVAEDALADADLVADPDLVDDADVAEPDLPDHASPDSDVYDADDVSDAGDADDADDADAEVSLPALVISSPYAVENAQNALSAFVGWRTSEPASAHLSVTCDDEPIATGVFDELLTERELFVMGLIADADCVVTVTASTSDGRTTTRPIELETPTLDDWPSVEVLHAEPERFSPGWTFFTLNDADRVVPNRVVAVDRQGRYRWLFDSPFTEAGTANEVGILPEGVLIGGGDDGMPIIASWDGRVIWQGTDLRNHHEIIWLPEENAFALMQRNFPDCPGENGHHYLSIFDRALDEVTWNWALCNHFTPQRPIHSWDHLNAVAFFPDRQSFLLSSRNQNSLFKIDRTTGEILWTLGYAGFIGGGFNGDFDMEPEDRFQAQHAPELLPNGNILLFDNGSLRQRPYSRAIEILYDESQWRARTVWEFSPEPRIFSDIWGDVDQLDDGNRLVTFGVRSQRDLTHIIEVQGTDPVWDLTLEAGWGTYRSVRLSDPVLIRQLD